MNCAGINKLSFISVLANMGYNPIKKSIADYWYLSPLRQETTPSFKINSEANVFYDFGLGKGGTVVDFLILYYNCSVKEVISRFSNNNFSFQPQPINVVSKKKTVNKNSIVVEKVKPLYSYSLVNYLKQRGISTQHFHHLSEVTYKVRHYKFNAIGFKNDAGGFELRSPKFKGCTQKAITSIRKDSSNLINVFEGFFDFLSYLHFEELHYPNESFLILNSITNIKECYNLLNDFKKIHLYLDTDSPGINTTKEILQKYNSAEDKSALYKHLDECKDLNDFLVKTTSSSTSYFN